MAGATLAPRTRRRHAFAAAPRPASCYDAGMWSDVVDLRDFYQTPLGAVARQLIRLRLRAVWPDLADQKLLGLGYATPYLRQFRAEAERVIAVMPAQQGVLHWPLEGPNAVTLADETGLPLPDVSMYLVLLVHGPECTDFPRATLRETSGALA